MKLLSRSKSKRDTELEAEQKRLVKLRLQKTIKEEEKKMSEIDLEPEKERRWKEFCAFNQDMQKKKALLIREIGELEHKRDVLEENLKIYI